MNHIEGNFKGVRNVNIYYQGWIPEGNIKAVLFLVHGLGEHSGRYTNLVDYFVPLGYAVYGWDHIGHGKSEGGREHVERFEDFTDNLTVYLNMVKIWQPDKPFFIYGHSLGGLIVPFYLLDHQALFKGAILSAPLAKVPSNISPMTITMGKILSAIAPKAGIIGLDVNTLSRDQEVVKAYVNDPLVFHGKTPARLSAEMLKAMLRVTAEVGRISLPLFVIQGGADRLVETGGSKMLYENARSADKTLKMYDGLYHEIHNEAERTIMFKDLDTWLKAHI